MKLENIGRILVGDNPFTGVDHLSQEKARDRNSRLNSSVILDVLDTAFKNGAEGLTFSAHPVMYDALKQFKKLQYEQVFGLYPIIPAADTYVRLASQKGVSGLMLDVLGRLTWTGRAKAMVGGGLSLVAPDPERVLKTFVSSEIESIVNVAPNGAKLKSIFLHEIITDLILSFFSKEILQTYVNYVNDKFQVRAGFVTRNFVKFTEFLKQTDIESTSVVIMTPFNKVGFQMTPSKQACEYILHDLHEINVIAMSILAAGYLKLPEAVDYLKLHRRLDAVTVGVSTIEHASETFRFLSRELFPPN
jgi:hypothetical protein